MPFCGFGPLPVSRETNGAIPFKRIIDWLLAKCVVHIVRTAIRQYVFEFSLAISVNSSFSHAGHALDRLFLAA